MIRVIVKVTQAPVDRVMRDPVDLLSMAQAVQPMQDPVDHVTPVRVVLDMKDLAARLTVDPEVPSMMVQEAPDMTVRAVLFMQGRVVHVMRDQADRVTPVPEDRGETARTRANKKSSLECLLLKTATSQVDLFDFKLMVSPTRRRALAHEGNGQSLVFI